MTTLIIGLLIPLLGTMLGSAFVFFMRDEMSVRLQKTLLGFASGVMVAAYSVDGNGRGKRTVGCYACSRRISCRYRISVDD